MKKFASFLSLLCLFNIVALAGLILFLIATGRLDKPKVQAITDMLRHQGTPNNYREQLYEILVPQTRPAAATATASSSRPLPLAFNPNAPASGDERIDYVSQAMEQQRIRLENEAQDLRHRQNLLESQQALLAFDRQKFEQEKKAWQQSLVTTSSKSSEESFQKTVALYNELKPQQVKELFLPMAPDLVAKYLLAMDTDRAGKIIAEFQSENDRRFISGVLELIRSSGTPPASVNRATGSTAAPGS